MQQVRARAANPTSLIQDVDEIRLSPVVHLLTGEIVNLVAETPRAFDDRVSFGGNNQFISRISPAIWLAHHVETSAMMAVDSQTSARPIIISAPISAMMHPDTPMACEAAAARSKLCPQEICIEVEDATLYQSKAEVMRSIQALRQRGFRVSVNATRSWCTPMDTDMRLLLDCVRIDANKIWVESDLLNRIEAASACGMGVIAENARYRDGEKLSAVGIELARAPKVDA
ncbi:EAL domain-containing protein [Henriciella litoralis]|uniref:EAL domain-containing protein n=1 Tax=Henriciella litoralis TaxID=568102 RepID=UPI000A01FDFD|nr:EAL domain-containing protein [Henriciella litoralis]